MPDRLYLEIVAPTGANTRTPTAELPQKGKLIVGSHAKRAQFVVEGQGVAEVHCAIGRLKDGGWALKDLGSEFGTRVNGEHVESARLKDGDEVLLGSRKLRVYDPTRAATPTEPARSAPGPDDAEATIVIPSDEPPEPRPQKAVPMPRASEPPGKVVEIAGYRIERPLGRGAMGDVFLATQTSLDRRVALKVLKRELGKDATFVERFRSEARAAARLNHPNVVTVYDVGEEHGRHFLSMEFMDGASVEVRLKKGGPLPWREALDVLRDAAAGLVYAESNGIVHRDIKPENLMRNLDGVTKIADLGLAAQVEQESVDAGNGKVLGTPHFIAPEVVRGGKADARSDMYSLGATAYRILSGRNPFEGANTREILRLALQEEPPPLGSLTPGLPAGIEAVVHRLLAKSPEDRYPSASILLSELERLRQSGGRDAEAATVASGAGGGSDPKRWALVGGGLIAAAAVAFALSRGGGDERPRDDFDGFPRRATDGTTASGDGTNGPGTSGPDDGDPGTATPTVDGDSGAPDGAVTTDGDGTANPIGGGADEADFEYQARLAYLALGDEVLTSEQRAARLRELSIAYAGTDIATEALAEAESLEAGVIAQERAEEALEIERRQAIDGLRAAAELDATPFHPGTALRAMRLVAVSEEMAVDRQFREARKGIVDEVLQKGLQRGRDAVAAADAAEEAGDFQRTQEALRGFIGATDLPSPEEAPDLIGDGAPASLAEFIGLAAEVRNRLDSLDGREAEFEADRRKRERIAIGRALGTQLEDSLRAFDLTAAAQSVADASGIASEPRLVDGLRTHSERLRNAEQVLETLVTSWDSPGWRRRGVADPRDGAEGTIDVVGVAPGAVLVGAGGAPDRLDFAAWAGRTAALRNLFLGRLERDWTRDEHRGIVALLTVSATLETLDALAPAFAPTATRIREEAAETHRRAFAEAIEWADGDAKLRAWIEPHRRAAEQLTRAIVAREEGDWSVSAEMLQRLIDEQRDTWIVMILSDGGKR